MRTPGPRAAGLARPLRLWHTALARHFVVEGDAVYADLDGDGRLTRADHYAGDAAPALLAAARELDQLFDVPYPGAKGADRHVVSGGRLNLREARAFAGAAGVPAKRSDLLAHLDFFDRRDGDGMICLRENYGGWRDLGYGAWKALTLTIGSAVVFGRPGDRFAIDVERIGERRPRGSTGIYGADGNVDAARLAAFAAAFDQAPGDAALTHDELRAVLASKAALGTVPRRQFESLCLLTEKLNGSKTVTKEQFLGLFDNSLFWTAVSLADSAGRRRL